MKTPLLLAVSCGALFLSSCTYDDDGYRTGSVSISTDPYYGDGYDEYSPYYSYSGRRYYRTGNRYVYYSDRRPSYVTTLPSSATYITPRRSSTRVVTRNDAPYYDAAGYDEYSPYYSYSGQRYYKTGNRYVSYSNRRPSYVSSLPTSATYITPQRGTTTRRVTGTTSRRVYDPD